MNREETSCVIKNLVKAIILTIGQATRDYGPTF